MQLHFAALKIRQKFDVWVGGLAIAKSQPAGEISPARPLHFSTTPQSTSTWLGLGGIGWGMEMRNLFSQGNFDKKNDVGCFEGMLNLQLGGRIGLFHLVASLNQTTINQWVAGLGSDSWVDEMRINFSLGNLI